ncbi:MAG: hypothetical protein ACAI35_16485 [Candidatus Methylacidiphilales bacterium]|nr:hypothetical protein [Candidatus Methylacidiphilales bacterium]
MPDPSYPAPGTPGQYYPGSPDNQAPEKKKPKYSLCLIITAIIVVISIPIVAIIAAVAIPAMGVAMDRAKKSADTQNIRMLGIALMAEASDSDDQTYPVLRDKDNPAKTSTEVFSYLYEKKSLPSYELVFSPGKDKVKHTGTGKLTSANVGYNYMKGNKTDKDKGVSMDADDALPLLWSSGNAPLIVRDGACTLELLDTGIWKKSGATVYYKRNNATFKRATSAGAISEFIPSTFNTRGVSYSELTP